MVKEGEPVAVNEADAADPSLSFLDGDSTALMRDLIGLYFTDIGQTPLLTAKEEIALAQQMEVGRKAGEALKENGLDAARKTELQEAVAAGQTARDHLIRASTRLVVSIAKKYQGRGLPFSDLIQEGNLGLLKAADKFDYRLGRFTTYATWWIRQAIGRAITDCSRTIRIPVRSGADALRLLTVMNDFLKTKGRFPDPAELANITGMPLKRVERLLEVASRFGRILSLDAECDDGSSGKNPLIELIPIQKKGPEAEIEERELKALLVQAFNDCNLTAREQYILILRFGLDGDVPLSLEDVGALVSLTRERVRQIQEAALRKIKNSPFEPRLKNFL